MFEIKKPKFEKPKINLNADLFGKKNKTKKVKKKKTIKKRLRKKSKTKKTTKRRGLGIKDKQILYDTNKGRCQCCKKKIDYSEMQVGHKIAVAKGNKKSLTLRGSLCLCYRCNKLMGTDNWNIFKKKYCKSKR